MDRGVRSDEPQRPWSHTKGSGILLALLVVLPIAGAGRRADAVSLTVEGPAAPVLPGESFEARVSVTGLGAGAAPSIGTFDLTLSFDPAVAEATGVAFGDAAGGSQLALGGPSQTGATIASGAVDAFEVSLDPASALDAGQPAGFVLLRATLRALGPGASALQITRLVLGDALGDPLPATLGAGSVSVVPEPTTALLLAAGLGALGLRSRTRPR